MMDIIQRYFDAFNADDYDTMLACVTEDVAHHVNEGKIRTGRAAFGEFCAHMARCYGETLTDIVVLSDATGTRAAAEYVVNGTYLATDPGMPEAHGQSYRLPAGSFFEVSDGQISRVTTYYNLADWMAQVAA